MITTITLNPAVDKTCLADALVPGQVNRMTRVENLAGGKGVNVTRVLRQYGQPARALGLIGGYTGALIEEGVRQTGAECCFTKIAGDTRCSMNIIAGDGYVTELLEPGPEITEKELEGFLLAYEQSLPDSQFVVLSGSVPKGVPEDIYARLIRKAEAAGKPALLDTSGNFLKEGVKARPFLVKPNLKELELLMGQKLKDREDWVDAARFLSEQGIPHVVVSLGARGLLYVHGEKILFVRAPRVKTVNTVGCGDCVVASFAISLLQQESDEDCIRKAAARAAANAATLKSAVIPMDIVGELMEKIEVERL